ncbi:MAG: hypothetical protein R6X20_06615 [Phycisphaerae bacterium]
MRKRSGVNPGRVASVLMWALCSLEFGCCMFPMDGLVELEGRVVEAATDLGHFEPTESMPPETVENIEGATVELWTRDGTRRLASWTTQKGDAGYFDVGYTGKYEPGREYILRVSAPDYQALEARIHMERHGYGVIYLAPSGTEDAEQSTAESPPK